MTTPTTQSLPKKFTLIFTALVFIFSILFLPTTGFSEDEVPETGGEVIVTGADEADGEEEGEPTEEEEEASAHNEPDYNTQNFFMHAGKIMLNPYKIIGDATTGYKLENSGDSDANEFIEFVYRDRTAWSKPESASEYFNPDFEFRLGYYNAKSDDESNGAITPGSSNASYEISLGHSLNCNIPFITDRCAFKKGRMYTINLDGIYGLITDKQNHRIHDYYGLGIVMPISIHAYKTDSEKIRNLEILVGLYNMKLNVPKFVDNVNFDIEQTTRGFPKFKKDRFTTLRGDVHFPFGENSYLTLASRFHLQDDKEDKILPWSISIGATIAIESIVDTLKLK
ncbi:MAG: hypothetical protein KAT46_03710 [Deltaproteobacteria bacterium]|nr:hypothetical protein [Deltaproteobacteria bacterium]